MKLKYSMLAGWRKVEGWQDKLDTTPADILPGSPHRTAVLLHDAKSQAMIFIVPLRLPSFFDPLKLVKVISQGHVKQGNLVSPIETDGSDHKFTYITPDGMSAGKVLIRKLSEEQSVYAVAVGLWPSEPEDIPKVAFELIAGSLRLA